MEKEKCLVPSVISLHVRAIDQNDKDSLKNLLNLPENNNNRKFSYNLVRIYNTGYSINRSKPVNENLPPYLSNVNAKSHFLSTALINSKFNALLKKTNSDCNSLYQNCRLSNSNHYWSNSFKNNQTNVSPVCQNVALSTPETDFSKPPNIIINATSLTSNRFPNEFVTQKTSTSLKKPSVILKSEFVNETTNSSNLYTSSKSPKSVENINKIPPILVGNTSPTSQIETPTNKNQIKKSNISTDKLIQKRSTSSFLIPIKERTATDSVELIALSPIRSHTLISKPSNSSQRSVPSSPFINCVESKKYQAITTSENPQKSAQPCLFSRINNSQSIFISNNQPFLYPDPCDSESTLSFLSRLSELSSYVSETIRWEKNRNSRRRCRPQTETV